MLSAIWLIDKSTVPGRDFPFAHWRAYLTQTGPPGYDSGLPTSLLRRMHGCLRCQRAGVGKLTLTEVVMPRSIRR